jgi:hypothetical protein
VVVTQERTTCRRRRPQDEFFTAGKQPGTGHGVPICRPCREKPWNNPDDPGETRDADVLAKAELRAERLAAIESARRA